MTGRCGVIGLAFGVGAVGGLVGAVLGGWIARWIGTGYTIAVGAVVFSTPSALVPWPPVPTGRRPRCLHLSRRSAGSIILFDINLNALSVNNLLASNNRY